MRETPDDLWEYLSRPRQPRARDGRGTVVAQRPRTIRAASKAASRPTRRASPATRAAVFFLSVATVAVLGVFGLRAIRSPTPATWPDRIAVVGLDETNRRQPVKLVAIVDPVRQTVVQVPPEALVEIPGSGFLRAYHAWRLGGAPLMRATLGRLFAVDVPFSASGSGDSLALVSLNFTQAEILSERLEDLRRTLSEAVNGWQVITLTGRPARGPRGESVLLDHESVRSAARAIGGYGTRVFATSEEVLATPAAAPAASPAAIEASQPPATGPAIAQSAISVDVLNGGSVELAATKTGQKLRAKGYKVQKIGDLKPQNRPRSVVYAKAGLQQKAEQVAAELGYPVERLPSGLSTTADVLVVVGHDARV